MIQKLTGGQLIERKKKATLYATFKLDGSNGDSVKIVVTT